VVPSSCAAARARISEVEVPGIRLEGFFLLLGVFKILHSETYLEKS
jgi:hypothetical protein